MSGTLWREESVTSQRRNASRPRRLVGISGARGIGHVALSKLESVRPVPSRRLAPVGDVLSSPARYRRDAGRQRLVTRLVISGTTSRLGSTYLDPESTFPFHRSSALGIFRDRRVVPRCTVGNLLVPITRQGNLPLIHNRQTTGRCNAEEPLGVPWWGEELQRSDSMTGFISSSARQQGCTPRLSWWVVGV